MKKKSDKKILTLIMLLLLIMTGCIKEKESEVKQEVEIKLDMLINDTKVILNEKRGTGEVMNGIYVTNVGGEIVYYSLESLSTLTPMEKLSIITAEKVNVVLFGKSKELKNYSGAKDIAINGTDAKVIIPPETIVRDFITGEEKRADGTLEVIAKLIMSDVNVGQNEKFKIKVTGSNFTKNVGGFDIRVKYNPTQLSLDGTASDAVTLLGGFTKAMSIINEPTTGEIIVTAAFMSGDATMNGDLFEIGFQSKTVSSSVEIFYTDIPDAADCDKTDKGVITVSGGSTGELFTVNVTGKTAPTMGFVGFYANVKALDSSIKSVKIYEVTATGNNFRKEIATSAVNTEYSERVTVLEATTQIVAEAIDGTGTVKKSITLSI